VSRARLRAVLHYNSKTGEFRWRKRRGGKIRAGDVAGTVPIDRYRIITINGLQYRAHRLAWFYRTGEWCPQVVDHRDGDPSNNRWSNLRRATWSQNNANRRVQRNKTCALKGVSRDRRGWRATIHKNGQLHYLGTFPTPQAAHAAYVKAARKLHGEFARTE
jgi:HNH endonuclease